MYKTVQVAGKNFTWSRTTRSGVAQASTLGLPPGVWPDVIVVCSAKTGSERTFVRYPVLDTLYEKVYTCTSLDPNTRDLRLVVLNT